ncbi:hypothetical protein NKOR_02925 [Candidatus Nitrosopumilus koreensis AR1]|uniref:Uncharacterized protein n=2 Tax=Nitrosopumilaceae TaxID=338190 RepID=K0B4W8_9ARCH|nr:hypothetical protein NKOR_02925 [Candidatus Nitrosopumilus koreensis AR1]
MCEFSQKCGGNMLPVCMICGKNFDGNKERFCSQSCAETHIKDLEKRLHDAIKNDPSHTKKMSDSSE